MTFRKERNLPTRGTPVVVQTPSKQPPENQSTNGEHELKELFAAPAAPANSVSVAGDPAAGGGAGAVSERVSEKAS